MGKIVKKAVDKLKSALKDGESKDVCAPRVTFTFGWAGSLSFQERDFAVVRIKGEPHSYYDLSRDKMIRVFDYALDSDEASALADFLDEFIHAVDEDSR